MQATCIRIGLWLVWAAAAPAWAGGSGLSVDPSAQAWPRWAARLQLGADPIAAPGLPYAQTRPRSVQLFGDYYVGRPRLGDAGGLRLTSGLLVGPRTALLDPAAAATDSAVTWPYFGVGYSATSVRSGWGFTADLGLAAQRPGAIRLGRLLGGTQSLDDLLRELRLQPLLQVGVSYAF